MPRRPGSPRASACACGEIVVPARITAIRAGTAFVPFHYGDWDLAPGDPDREHHRRAANELTITAWDPASKQPLFKVAAVRVSPRSRRCADD